MGRIWSLIPQLNSFTQLTNWTDLLLPDQGQIDNISSFGEDAQGNLYVVDFDGEIFKFIGNTDTDNNEDTETIAPVVNLLLDD